MSPATRFFKLAALVLSVAPLTSRGTVLVYEGFGASASGAGDDYQYDSTIRGQADARTGLHDAEYRRPLPATG